MASLYPARNPAIPVAVVLAAGILADRWLNLPLASWLTAAVVCGLFAVAARRRDIAPAAYLVLAWIFVLGAARHHLFWSTTSADDISWYADEEPRPIRLVGLLTSEPEVVSPSTGQGRAAWAIHDTTVAMLQCREIVAARRRIPVCGQACLRVNGQMLHVETGDEIEVCGWLMRPRGASNPGTFDPGESLRRRGARCLVTTDRPEAVTCVERGSNLFVARWAARIRSEGEALFARDLSSRAAPVAAALLFGTRSQIDEETRDAFVRSGMLHVLAISGMHVAILATLVWTVGRLIGFSIRKTVLATIVLVLAYALLTDGRPPVIRATVFICLSGLSRIWFRRPPYMNSLALAAIAIMLWNPTDLFDVGAQLSFLGVLGVLWAPELRGRLSEVAKLRRNLAMRSQIGLFHRWANRLPNAVVEGYVIAFAAALFTAPLIAARFHLVSPIGLLINVGLVPLSTVVLWLGYAYLAVGLIAPWAAHLPGLLFGAGLDLFLSLVRFAARVKLSHFYVPGPPDWWLAGFYFLLIALAFWPSLRRLGYGRWSALVAWSLLLLALGLRSPAPDGFRCTFLSVGHGGAIVMEFPSGRTLVYDAGSLSDGQTAERAVLSALWNRGHTHIDAIIASHADVDHFNGITGLMKSVPVGKLLVSQQFLDFRQRGVALLCDSSAELGVPIELVSKGNRLGLDDRVTLTILHPGFGRPQADDNANSVVLLVEFAGRRILLTGDLESSGLATLLQTAPRHIDVLLAPHHGSRRANSPALAAWATPSRVIASCGPRVDFASLRAAYGPHAEILSTHQAGAITIEIDGDGMIRQTTMRPVRSGIPALASEGF